MLKIDKNNFEPSSLDEVGEILKAGGIVIFPTDTVYGIGCDPFKEKSVARIYELKKRELNKPFPILLSNINVAHKIATLNKYEEVIINKFWPGQLTLVVTPKIKFLNYFLNAEGKVAIRVPNNPIPRRLAEYTSGMLVGTSANISGMKSPTTANEALSYITDVDAVIDSGPSDTKYSSTIIEIVGKKIKLIREGPIAISEIEKELEF